jgi:uncharacterized protein YbjT (DUF2867 family)
MFVSVRRYTVGAGSIDGVARRLDEEFAPALSQEPGFLGYLALDLGDRVVETISVFENEPAARRSDQLAAEYVADNLGDFRMERTDQTGGPVLASRAAPPILEPALRRMRARRRRGPHGEALVVGATGRTGRQIVARMLERGLPVRALVRDPDRGRAVLPEGARQVVGDLRRPETLPPAMEGVGTVIVATSGGSEPDNSAVLIDYFGTEHVLRAAVDAGVELIVFVSSIYATRPDYYQDVEPSSLGWKARAEELVRASGVPYSIVRAAWLTDGAGGEPLTLTQGDVGEGHVSRADLAAACVDLLSLESARGKTFELFAAREASAVPLERLVATLAPDGPTTRDARSEIPA